MLFILIYLLLAISETAHQSPYRTLVNDQSEYGLNSNEETNSLNKIKFEKVQNINGSDVQNFTIDENNVDYSNLWRNLPGIGSLLPIGKSHPLRNKFGDDSSDDKTHEDDDYDVKIIPLFILTKDLVSMCNSQNNINKINGQSQSDNESSETVKGKESLAKNKLSKIKSANQTYRSSWRNYPVVGDENNSDFDKSNAEKSTSSVNIRKIQAKLNNSSFVGFSPIITYKGKGKNLDDINSMTKNDSDLKTIKGIKYQFDDENIFNTSEIMDNGDDFKMRSTANYKSFLRDYTDKKRNNDYLDDNKAIKYNESLANRVNKLFFLNGTEGNSDNYDTNCNNQRYMKHKGVTATTKNKCMKKGDSKISLVFSLATSHTKKHLNASSVTATPSHYYFNKSFSTTEFNESEMDECNTPNYNNHPGMNKINRYNVFSRITDNYNRSFHSKNYNPNVGKSPNMKYIDNDENYRSVWQNQPVLSEVTIRGASTSRHMFNTLPRDSYVDYNSKIFQVLPVNIVGSHTIKKPRKTTLTDMPKDNTKSDDTNTTKNTKDDSITVKFSVNFPIDIEIKKKRKKFIIASISVANSLVYRNKIDDTGGDLKKIKLNLPLVITTEMRDEHEYIVRDIEILTSGIPQINFAGKLRNPFFPIIESKKTNKRIQENNNFSTTTEIYLNRLFNYGKLNHDTNNDIVKLIGNLVKFELNSKDKNFISNINNYVNRTLETLT